MSRKMKTMDGNTAAAHVSYAFTDVAAIYPITPSSTMAEATDKWAADGKKNLFGQKVKVVEMQSEAGAAGALHGSLTAGALTTTFTASQGLLLMIPNMYKIAGERLPAVINVSARAIASHALSIFGDHSDIYACRQTGFAMICSSNVQECMDLGAVAHLAAIKGSLPFLHFFDGFRTSHEIQKIEMWSDEDLASMLDMEYVNKFRKRALNPNHPTLRGTAQNPDIFFQAREACNKYYDEMPDIVESYMNEINKRINTDYKLFNYYGDPKAENIIIAMGSVCDTIEETVDYLNKNGEKVGLIKVRLYRPFSVKHLLSVIPETAKYITVLDRTKEPGSIGEPLYLDVALAVKGTKFDKLPMYSGRYGLGSKDTTPAQIIAVYENAKSSNPKQRFTIGICDDVTNLSLDIKEDIDTTPAGTTSCKFWGLGSDGTVGANKNSIKIIGDHTDMYVQAYFAYDSKKSGGVTISHLRFGNNPIKSTYFVNKADFVACHNASYINKYDMVQDIKPGGTFLLNCSWDENEIEKHLPAKVKKYIAENNIKFYVIDGLKIAKEIGLGGRINTILQAAFFNLAKIIKPEDAVKYMKDAATASYMKKGPAIVEMNHAAIEKGISGAKEVKVPENWKNASDVAEKKTVSGENKDLVDFVNNIQIPVNNQQGDKLPVSAFEKISDGTVPQGSAAYEKRGIAVDVPCWISENCIQCNLCSYVCPHAVIRPFVLTEEEAKNAPEGIKLIDMMGMPGYKFTIGVSALDCTGCGVCANICPGKKGEKAVTMKSLAEQDKEQEIFNYCLNLPQKEEVFKKFSETTIKGSQFKRPLLEFSGACAGCGEPAYAKLATQLFGDRMYIANATGCSSIWAGSAPSTPYTTNEKGEGPAWANSLFEDNAEFGYGIYLASQTLRNKLIEDVKTLSEVAPPEKKVFIDEYLKTLDDGKANKIASEKLVEALSNCSGDFRKECHEIVENKEFLAKKSVWILGGDGWAYDIGFGGLDHVIASGEDVNILVFDTEVYSNTGGQSSKSTPTGAIAQFAAAGKEVKKKDLASIAMSYGYVYVAQVAMGADYAQCIKAFNEAESYKGPSIIIAYAPCINHGIKGGLVNSQSEAKNAVLSGYWHLFRFDPRLKVEGKNPFQLDSKEPTGDYKEFINNESRYNSLKRFYPDRAELLFDKAEESSKDRYNYLLRLSKLYE